MSIAGGYVGYFQCRAFHALKLLLDPWTSHGRLIILIAFRPFFSVFSPGISCFYESREIICSGRTDTKPSDTLGGMDEVLTDLIRYSPQPFHHVAILLS